MAYGEIRKKKKRELLGTQIDVYNVHGGRKITMDDDGVSKSSGQANQQRQHVLRKLAQRDSDGDPMFVLCTPLKDHTIEADRYAGGGQELNGRRTLEDRSASPDFETIGDKFKANEAAREQHMRDVNVRRYGEEKSPGRSKLRALAAPAAVVSAKADAKKANKAAAGAVKPGSKPKAKQAESAA